MAMAAATVAAATLVTVRASIRQPSPVARM